MLLTNLISSLVHDTDVFIVLTKLIKDKLNSIELPNLFASIEEPVFHSWFVKNMAPYMGKHMVTNVKERNGLPCDFLINQSKSLNAKFRKTNIERLIAVLIS